MQIKPYLTLGQGIRPGVTYGIDNSIAYKQTWPFGRTVIPLQNATLETPSSMFAYGKIIITNGSTKLVWEHVPDRRAAMAALEEAMYGGQAQAEVKTDQASNNENAKVCLAEGYKMESLRAMQFTPNGNRLAVSCIGKTVIWDVVTGQLLCKLKYSCADTFIFNENSFVIGCNSSYRNILRECDLSTIQSDMFSVIDEWNNTKYIKYIKLEAMQTTSAASFTDTKEAISKDIMKYAYSYSGRTIDDDSSYKILEIIDILEVKLLYTPFKMANAERHKGGGWVIRPYEIESMTFNFDGTKLAFGVTKGSGYENSSGKVYLFNLNTGENIILGNTCEPTFLNHITHFLWYLPMGKSNFSSVTQWWKEKHKEINSITFNRDGKKLASGCSYGKIIIWDVAMQRRLHTLEPFFQGSSGHKDRINSLSFNRYGNKLASGSNDKTIKVWDVATGKLVQTLTGHKSRVTSVAFSPNSDKLFSASEDGTVRCWNTQTSKELVQLITFEDDEWLALTPEGYYHGSANAEKYLNVRQGSQVIPFTESYKQQFNRPDIIAQRLRA